MKLLFVPPYCRWHYRSLSCVDLLRIERSDVIIFLITFSRCDVMFSLADSLYRRNIRRWHVKKNSVLKLNGSHCVQRGRSFISHASLHITHRNGHRVTLCTNAAVLEKRNIQMADATCRPDIRTCWLLHRFSYHAWWNDSRRDQWTNHSEKVLLVKLRVHQLVKKFPTFYGTQRLITIFTTVLHLSLSQVTFI